MKRLAILTLCAALGGTSASSAVIVNITETPDDWTAAYAGSLDVSNLTRSSIGQERRELRTSDGSFFLMGLSDTTIFGVERYSLVSGPGVPTEPGTQYWLPRNSSTPTGAGAFGILVEANPSRNYVAVPIGFESGFIEGFTRWPGRLNGPIGLTLADSELMEGRYVYGLANGETITLNIGNDYAQALPRAPGVPAVPLPAGLPLLAGGVMALAALRRRGGT